MNKNIFVILSTILLFQISCAPIKDKKSFSYFNNLPTDSVFVVDDPGANIERLLKPGDIISVLVNTKDATTNAMFNTGVLNTSTSSSSNGSGTNFQVEGYKIDNNGNITMPVIGKINLNGKSLEEAEKIIAQKISTQAKDPIVAIKLQNAKVLIMGEINAPGSINISDKTTTLLEAIGMAGDVKITANKGFVRVIRSENGKKEFANLNLNDISSINSPYYYLHQNDVVIVYPNSIMEKQARGALTGIQATQLGLGLLGSALGVVNMMLTLNLIKKTP